MTQKKLPPHIVLQESKEVIFYLENPLPSEITIPTWMTYFPDDYKGMIYLEQLDNLHQVIYRGIMVDAWPMQIGVMNMSSDNKDTIQEVNAQFNYRFWYSEYTNSKPDTFLGGILNKFGKKIGSKITSKLEDMVF